MADPKPIASLSPTLLARKGGAKPAMRSQVSALLVSHDETEPHEDLGWNDMGHDHAHNHETGGEVVPIGRDLPHVVRQQRAIASALGEERHSALANGRRAAFTLRLDGERHLKLRLACTLSGRSAQQLVTEALDKLLSDQPQIAELAAQVTAKRT